MSIMDLTPPSLEGVHVAICGEDVLKLSGTLAIKEPGHALGPFLRRVHDEVRGSLACLRVDVSCLTFVNSSAIRLLVDWATWLRKEPVEYQYELRFLTDRTITWQRTSLAALRALAGALVSVEAIN